MSTELDSALLRLEQLASELNRRTDDLNAQIAAVNARLAAMKIGVSIWLVGGRPHGPVLLDPDGDSSHETGSQLGYAKVNGTWQLAVRSVIARNKFFEGDESMPYVEETKGDPTPLLDAPRSIRLAAVAHLPQLIESLAAKASGFLSDLDRVSSRGPQE